jgi:pimeloyl-ACP methyl ester carboxylesterase
VISPQDVEVYAQALRDPARLRASFEYFRAFPTDIADVGRWVEEGPLEMPVLALGAEHSMGDTVADLARKVATDVTGGVIADSGHWIPEEKPRELLDRLVDFLP